MNLYEINQALAERMTQLGELLQDGGTPSDDEVQAILDLKDDLNDKLIGYGKYITNQQADIDALDSEIKRLSAKKSLLARRNELLKQNMLAVMIERDIARIDDLVMPIRVQNNSVFTVTVNNPADLPPEYQVIKVEANKKALTAAYKNGISLDGVTVEKGKHIRIG